MHFTEMFSKILVYISLVGKPLNPLNRIMKKNLSVLFLSAIIFLFLVSPSFSQTGKVVKAIEIEGNKTISIAVILSKIKTRVGQASQ